ncbi:nucleoside phosphorylase [Leptolyngbya sp. PCC 6406]|uniref:VMAP-C domain-containing protein n=1 Tax=Leptolyngbya sp. PCC 6406 TaxID=1173264 RepID=UPI0002ABA176|nr:nucleoside phosphorylase [Leptolyngbya sp. PCC 6406]
MKHHSQTGRAETSYAIDHFQPQVVLFVGIAGGIKDVDIGHVVAATKVCGYESGKVDAQEFKTRRNEAQSSYALVSRARAEARKPDWLERLTEQPEPVPEVWVQPIAAGEKVVASTQSSTFKLLETDFSDAIAVEMEGYGFSRAVYASPKVSSIVIRGISDLIDGKNDAAKYGPEPDRHRQASAHASAFAFQILAKFDPNPSILGAKKIAPQIETRFWDGLFACFQEPELAFLKVALEDVLIADKRDLLGLIATLEALRTFLVRQDDQDLALAWVKRLIDKANQVSEEEADFIVTSALQTWYEVHKPPETASELGVEPSSSPRGYLLVTLEPVAASGVVEDGKEADNVRLMVELHLPGETPRTDYFEPDTQCSIDEVGKFLSKVVPRAGKVKIVEIFLSWQHWGEPVHNWQIQSRSRGPVTNFKRLWELSRNTVVRSLDRLQDPEWSEEWIEDLKARLQQLQSLKEICTSHVFCTQSFSDDLMNGALCQKLIFKFWTALPEDKLDLAKLLFEVIEQKVPVWVWAYQQPPDAIEFFTRVDRLLTPDNLKDSALLAQAILNQRQDLRELGLLFDCHTRIPRLPTLAVDASGRLRQPAA